MSLFYPFLLLCILSFAFSPPPYSSIDWTLPQYYSTYNSLSIGTNLYYFVRGPDTLFLEELNTVTQVWQQLSYFSYMTDADGWNAEMRYQTIRMAAVGTVLYVFGRGENHTYMVAYDTATQSWTIQPSFPCMRDSDGYTLPQYYRTVRIVSLSNSLYILARQATGIQLVRYQTTTQTWNWLASPTEFTDDTIWNQYKYYASFRLVGDGSMLWLYARGPNGNTLLSYDTGTNMWSATYTYAFYTDANGWSVPYYFEPSDLLLLNSVPWMLGRGSGNVYTSVYYPSTGVFIYKAYIAAYQDAGSWYLSEYYPTIQYVVCANAVYVVGRGSGGVYPISYSPDAWAYLPNNMGLMTNAQGWDITSCQRSFKLHCIGNNVYYVGRRGAEVKAVSLLTATNTWSAAYPSLFAPCFNTCITCQGGLASDCLTCPAGTRLQGGTGPAPCICPSHMYSNPDIYNCAYCHPHCEECSAGLSSACTACQTNSLLSPTHTCDCVTGFYWSAADVCVRCEDICTVCSGINICQACIALAELSGTRCVCSPGYFFDEVGKVCVPCDSSCAECGRAGNQGCTGCGSGAVLKATPMSACMCMLGYYSTPSGSCPSCHSQCLTCDGPLSTNCLSCLSGSFLSSDRSCHCLSNYYRFNSDCLPCYGTCAECNGPMSVDCLSCFPGAALEIEGSCRCLPGFFLSNWACDRCLALCSTCSSLFVCQSCRSNAGLDATSICKCSSGFYESSGVCLECPEGCKACKGSTCWDCSVQWYLYSATCVKECPTSWEPSNSSCVPSPLHAFLSDSPTNLLTLVFSQPVTRNLTYSDLHLSVMSTSSNFTPTWSLIPIQAYCLYNLSLSFTSELPAAHSTLQLNFLDPDLWTTEAGSMLVDTQLSVPLNPYSPSTTVSAEAAAAAQGSVAGVAVLSILGGNPSTLFGLINQLQLITYIPLLSVDMPDGLRSVLAALNSNGLVHSPLEGLITCNSAAAIPLDSAQRYGFSSTLFLSNSSFAVMTFVALGVSYVAVTVLTKLTAFPIIATYFREIQPRFRHDYPLKAWQQVYMDIGIATLVQFSTLSSYNSDPILILNVAIAAIALAAFTASPFVVMQVIATHTNLSPKLSALLVDLKAEGGVKAHLYSGVFLFRRTLYAVILLTLGDHSAIQALSCVLLAASVLIYLLIIRPFASNTLLLTSLLSELVTCGTLVLASLYLVLEPDSVSGKRVEQAAILLVYGGIVGCAGLSLWQFGCTVKDVVARFRRIKAEMKILQRERDGVQAPASLKRV